MEGRGVDREEGTAQRIHPGGREGRGGRGGGRGRGGKGGEKEGREGGREGGRDREGRRGWREAGIGRRGRQHSVRSSACQSGRMGRLSAVAGEEVRPPQCTLGIKCRLSRCRFAAGKMIGPVAHE